LKTLLSTVFDVFKKRDMVAPSPPPPLVSIPTPITNSDPKLKMLLDTVFNVFKPSKNVNPLVSKPAAPKNIQALPSPTIDPETKLKLMLDTVYQLFERRLPQVSEGEPKEEKPKEEEPKEVKEKEEHYKPPKVVYEPDMNSDECLEHLDPTLHEFYEPITTYIDEDLRQGTCVYKLKDRNTADGAKEKTIHRTYPLQAA
jgi:hypothetical protein